MHSLNDKIRYKIFEECGCEASVIDFYDYYYSLNEEQKEYIMRMMISDYYKQYMPRIPSFGKPFLSIDELIIRLENDYNLMEKILIEEIDYLSLSNIEKQDIIKTITILNKDKLHYSIFNGHVLDMIAYNKKYTLEEMRLNYLDYTNNNGETEESKYCILNLLLEELDYIKQKNKNEYNMIILKLAKDYYIWEKYFIENIPELVGAEEYIIIELIEKSSLNELIRVISSNEGIKKELLFKYVSQYHIDREVNELVIDYALENTDIEIIKKLEI